MADEPVLRVDEGELRALVPRVLAGLVRRGEDFDAAEDALQEALLDALRIWPEPPPDNPRAWLAAVGDAAADRRAPQRGGPPRPRGRSLRRAGPGHRERRRHPLPALPLLPPRPHARLPVALTLRAVGGLSTREIADAFFVPEATMAQRISRAKRSLRDRRLDEPGDVAVVLRVLYLVYTTGHGGRLDLAARGDPARPPAHPGHRRAGGAGVAGADAAHHARLPARLMPTAGSSRSTSRTAAAGTRADRRGRGVLQGGARRAAAGPLPGRGRHRRAPRRRRDRGRDRLAADPGLVRRAGRRSPPTRCATTRPRC